MTSYSVSIQYPRISEEPQDAIHEELERLSVKLQALLPDPSLSPLERVERLARVIPESIQDSSQHLTARKKLNQIRLRLADLIPDSSLNAEQRIDLLVQKAHELVPGPAKKLFEKLEKIGDQRMIDNGGVPFPGWTLEDRFWPHLPSKKNSLDTEGGGHVTLHHS